MKKFFIVIGIAASVVVFSNCSSTKKTASTSKVQTSTWTNDVSVVIMNKCTPCHIPSKGGNKKPYDNYTNTKTDIDEIIRRIELNPGDKGFMPFKHPKLNDSTIMVFKKWKTDGLLEN